MSFHDFGVFSCARGLLCRGRRSILAVLVLTGTVMSLPAGAADRLPEVVEGAYDRLPPVNIYDGAGPGLEGWIGKIDGPVTESRLPDGDVVNVTTPTLTAFIPDKARSTRSAVLVAPGGGFRELSMEREGHMVAKWLAERGIAAFVLKYRLVQSADPENSGSILGKISITEAAMPGLEDGVRAIEFIRERASDYNIDPDKVGAIGFSAGAHIAARLAMLEEVPSRANFAAPIYGSAFDAKAEDIPDSTAPDALPPMFFAMAQDDVFVRNGVFPFLQSLRDKGYLMETHLYMRGGHGFSMRDLGTTSDHFMQEFYWWLQAQNLARKPGDPYFEPVPAQQLPK